MSDEVRIPSDPEAPIEVRVILIGKRASALRALCEMYREDANTLADRLIAIGAKDLLGEIQFRQQAAKRGKR